MRIRWIVYSSSPVDDDVGNDFDWNSSDFDSTSSLNPSDFNSTSSNDFDSTSPSRDNDADIEAFRNMICSSNDYIDPPAVILPDDYVDVSLPGGSTTRPHTHTEGPCGCTCEKCRNHDCKLDETCSYKCYDHLINIIRSRIFPDDMICRSDHQVNTCMQAQGYDVELDNDNSHNDNSQEIEATCITHPIPQLIHGGIYGNYMTLQDGCTHLDLKGYLTAAPSMPMKCPSISLPEANALPITKESSFKDVFQKFQLLKSGKSTEGKKLIVKSGTVSYFFCSSITFAQLIRADNCLFASKIIFSCGSFFE